MPWIAAIVSAAYSGFQQHSKNKQAKKNNARNEKLFANDEPDYFGRAMRGFTGGNQYQKDLTAIAQGTYMDPNVLAKPISDINMNSDTNMQRVAATIGKSNMSGGLANAYALANRTSGSMNKATLKQNYGMWREKQRRTDLDWINQQKNADLARRSGNAVQIADRHQDTGMPPWMAAIGSGWGTWAGSEQGKNFLNKGEPLPGAGRSKIQGEEPLDWNNTNNWYQQGKKPQNWWS